MMSGFSSNDSMTTAVPCGISSFRVRSSFSRMISAASALSGWSVIMSSGKNQSLSCSSGETSSVTIFTPSPLIAAIGMTAWKSNIDEYAIMHSATF